MEIIAAIVFVTPLWFRVMKLTMYLLLHGTSHEFRWLHHETTRTALSASTNSSNLRASHR